MALAPLSPIQQKAQGAALLAEAKRAPDMSQLLQCLPTRCSGQEKWEARLEAAGKLFRELVNQPAQSLNSEDREAGPPPPEAKG